MADGYGSATAGKASPATEPDLTRLKKMVDDWRTTFAAAITESQVNRDYYDNKQLTTKQREVLESRRQPQNIYNRVAPAINGILGVVVQGKTDPRALMRNPPQKPPQAPQGAMMAQASQMPMGQMAPAEPTLDAGDVATMALRYIADVSQFQATKLDVLENMAIEGSGAVAIEFTDDQEVTISHIRWEEHFYDPHSRRADFSDARYQGVAKWMYVDDVSVRFPDKKKELEDACGRGDIAGSGASVTEDRPNLAKAWTDPKNKRLMVADAYYREDGIWQRCIFYSGGTLHSGPSQYKDDKGHTLCGIEAQSAFVDRDNNRYGLVSAMRGPQDDINMRRIKAVHEINTRQIQLEDPNAPPIDVDLARAEAARPDGVIPTGYKVVPRQDAVANNITLLQEAKAEIERMGPNPAILGRQGADASGRAQQIRQEAGMVELARFLGRFTDWEQRVYRQMWARARQSWTDAKWIRVTDDAGAPQYVRINEPAPIDPMTGQPIGKPKNHIADMDVDIIVDSVPDTATLQQEVFNEFMQLAQAYVGTPQQIPMKTLIEISSLPKKADIIKKLDANMAEAAQSNAPAQAVEMAGKQADVAKTHADAFATTEKGKLTEVQRTIEAMHGHMDAHAANLMPPGVSEVANLPQNLPQPPPG